MRLLAVILTSLSIMTSAFAADCEFLLKGEADFRDLPGLQEARGKFDELASTLLRMRNLTQLASNLTGFITIDRIFFIEATHKDAEKTLEQVRGTLIHVKKLIDDGVITLQKKNGTEEITSIRVGNEGSALVFPVYNILGFENVEAIKGFLKRKLKPIEDEVFGFDSTLQRTRAALEKVKKDQNNREEILLKASEAFEPDHPERVGDRLKLPTEKLFLKPKLPVEFGFHGDLRLFEALRNEAPKTAQMFADKQMSYPVFQEILNDLSARSAKLQTTLAHVYRILVDSGREYDATCIKLFLRDVEDFRATVQFASDRITVRLTEPHDIFEDPFRLALNYIVKGRHRLGTDGPGISTRFALAETFNIWFLREVLSQVRLSTTMGNEINRVAFSYRSEELEKQLYAIQSANEGVPFVLMNPNAKSHYYSMFVKVRDQDLDRARVAMIRPEDVVSLNGELFQIVSLDHTAEKLPRVIVSAVAESGTLKERELKQNEVTQIEVSRNLDAQFAIRLKEAKEKVKAKKKLN